MVRASTDDSGIPGLRTVVFAEPARQHTSLHRLRVLLHSAQVPGKHIRPAAGTLNPEAPNMVPLLVWQDPEEQQTSHLSLLPSLLRSQVQVNESGWPPIVLEGMLWQVKLARSTAWARP